MFVFPHGPNYPRSYGRMYQAFQKLVMVYETEPDNFPRLMELMQDVSGGGTDGRTRVDCKRVGPSSGRTFPYTMHKHSPAPALTISSFAPLPLPPSIPPPLPNPQLQECGQPPSEIIKDLAPGLELSPDGLPLMPNMGPGMPEGMPGTDGAPGLPGQGCSVM